MRLRAPGNVYVTSLVFDCTRVCALYLGVVDKSCVASASKCTSMFVSECVCVCVYVCVSVRLCVHANVYI